ncbi:MAG: hypothetical protein C0467_28710 [Planctomycetaceae bacterium]|nr:hypothetical protein [Planctomycetaceae bacterium]
MNTDTTEKEPPHVTLTITPAAGKPGRFLAVAVNGVGELHRDAIDLNSAVSRKRFLTAAAGKVFGNPKDERLPPLLADLEKQLLAAAKVPPGATDPVATKADSAPVDPRLEALAKMPEDIRAEAVATLESPDLVKTVLADLEKAGVVGESRTALTLYMVGTSAQLKRPLAAIVRGSSSSGKSYVVGVVSSMFPGEIVLQATSLTTNALYYFPPDFLRHRWVVCGERSRVEDDDKAETTRALREMIESGRLSKAVPRKNAEGKIVTELVEREGPIGFVETTTLGAIFDEDANRCLLLATDESKAQTQAINKATATCAAGIMAEHSRRRDVHFAIQRMIPRVDVVIPFAEQVAALYPCEQVDARRSFRHLLNLVRASALLHFRQRDRDDEGRIVATFADYALAERLGRGPLADASSGVSDGARQYLTALRDKFSVVSFSTSEAQTVGVGSRPTRYRRLLELHSAGALEQTEPQKGRVPAQWRLTEVDVESGATVLPTVERVMKAALR